MICPAIHSEQPKASNIQKAFLRQSGLTALISSVPFTNSGIRQSTISAAVMRFSPAGTSTQIALYPAMTMIQGAAMYQFAREAVFIVRLIHQFNVRAE